MAKEEKSFEREAEKFATNVVGAVVRLRAALKTMREMIAADAKKDDPRDATAIAGYLGRALIDAGGLVPETRMHALRWVINEAPRPEADPEAIAASGQLVTEVLASLSRAGGGHDAARLAEEWPKHRTKARAEAAVAEIVRAEVKARDAKIVEEHLGRIAKRDAHKVRVIAGGPTRSKIAPGPVADADAGDDAGDGEFTIAGDDAGDSGGGEQDLTVG